MNTTKRGHGVIAHFLALAALVSLSCDLGSTTHVCESGRRCKPGQVCAVAQDVCIDIGGCGDGVVNAARQEVCDDGNIRGGDGCSQDCRSKEICGNGILDIAVGEQCDQGPDVPDDNCSPTCRLETCGNGFLDPMEVCDDGNVESGDGCRKDCMSYEVCGNGILDQEVTEDGVPVVDATGTPILYEECDPAMPGHSPATCDSDCTLAACGDGFYNPDHEAVLECPGDPSCERDMDGHHVYEEQCDTGGDSATCDANCTIPICGDGYTNVAIEECDPGELGLSTEACNANCTNARCGDGFWNPLFLVTPTGGGDPVLEQCDEGGDTPECDADCTVPECGDGHRNRFFIIDEDSGQTEECDSSGIDTSDCNFDCTEPTCGDGHLNRAADEECGEPGAEPCPLERPTCSACRCT